MKPICSRPFKATFPPNVHYRVINKPRVERYKAIPWDQLTRDANGRVVIDEKLTG
jgi:hypothetical protein